MYLQIKQEEVKLEERKAFKAQKEIEKTKVEGEEKRKNLDKNLEVNKKSQEYQDRLARQRYQD